MGRVGGKFGTGRREIWAGSRGEVRSGAGVRGSLEVMSLHVVIAGSSGFLGTHLRQALRERGLKARG